MMQNMMLRAPKLRDKKLQKIAELINPEEQMKQQEKCTK